MNEPITKVQRIVRAEHVDHDWPGTVGWVPCTIPVVLKDEVSVFFAGVRDGEFDDMLTTIAA